LVERLDREGWRCFAGYNRQPPTELLAGCSERVAAIQCDITDNASVTRALLEVGEALGDGGLDLLVNNAGTTGGAGGGIENVDIDAFKFLFEVNFWGPIRVVQAALPLIRRSAAGRIINVGSASQYLNIPIGSSYPVTKAALKRVTQALRIEMRPFGIEVTCLEPGGVSTDMLAISDEQEAQLWASFPEHLLPAYRKHFKFPSDAVESTFPAWTPEQFVDRVFRDILSAKKLKPNYLLGPQVGALAVMERVLPLSLQEKFFEKLFRR
jgi:NAD(P)-dependent dehydrogenase (short-subunit alcohol dehydrogenase family)